MQYNFLVYVNRGKLYELIGPFGKFKVEKVFIQKLTLFHITYRIRAFKVPCIQKNIVLVTINRLKLYNFV